MLLAQHCLTYRGKDVVVVVVPLIEGQISSCGPSAGSMHHRSDNQAPSPGPACAIAAGPRSVG